METTKEELKEIKNVQQGFQELILDSDYVMVAMMNSFHPNYREYAKMFVESTSQKETIERLREALSKSSAIIWDVLEEGVEGSFPIRSQYDKNLQLLKETNLHNYEIPERDTNTKLQRNRTNRPMNMEEKLDINHVKHYLGTGVQIRWSNHVIETSTLDHSNIDVLLYHPYHKMLLHPLDRLTEPILEGGVTPIEWVKKIWGYEVFEYVGYQRFAYMFKLENNTPAILHLPFCFIEKFLEWHFDIFGLIEKGLALPIDPK